MKGKKVLILMVILIINVTIVFGESNNNIDTAKKGIVQVFAGVNDQNGYFHKIKSSTGFLVSNSEDEVYIITTYQNIFIKKSDKEKISKDISTLSDSIKVVVKGDITSSLSIVTMSKNDDFCILQGDSVIKEKKALKLLNNQILKEGSKVYALGFINKSSKKRQFDESEVDIQYGSLLKKETTSITHSAVIKKNNSGGPLLDEKGYVIGMNNIAGTKNSSYYSLSIDCITSILDNYGITYDNYDLDIANKELKSLYNECNQLMKNSQYKNNSSEELQSVLQTVSEVLESNTRDIKVIKSYISSLKKLKSQFRKKVSTVTVIKYILLGIIVLLLIRLIQLLYFNNKIYFSKQKKNTKNIVKNSKIEKTKQIKTEKENSQDIIQDNVYEETILLFDYKKDISESIDFFKREKIGQLVFVKNNIIYEINKSKYILGRNKKVVDCYIADNPYVARIHAIIFFEQNGYVLYDQNTKNGTFVNQVKITNKGYLLHDGDEIVLANERIIFHEYILEDRGDKNV